MWRWDQGRLEYFNFQNIRDIARGLLKIENVSLDTSSDPLRAVLPSAVGLPFLPDHYKVWRNYKRVIECSLVATSVDGKVVLTDVGRKLALDETFTVDEYLTVVAKRFRFPFPAFSDYDDTTDRVYPFIAVLKLLFSKLANGHTPQVTVQEVGSLLVGNNCSGNEPIEYYATLQATAKSFASPSEERQTREMMIFLSQFSFLKWENPVLKLDLLEKAIPQSLLDVAVPDAFAINPTPKQELMAIAKPSHYVELDIPTRNDVVSEVEFIEGKRERKTHIVVERSPTLRNQYFIKHPTSECDMCAVNTKHRYPWSKNLLEIHHLLPLSSSIAVGARATLLTDVVPLCPTCHRAVHSYYRVWLTTNSRSDFSSKAEANAVYQEAVKKVVI